ncbi:MAG TPA: carboxypeptidase-like regulatory domain-containing protein, partial [Acidobacteriota bacterium]|nr:carboxypeptidase-like regulatory domain-containing protein [Acidobacteriota bacterium]
MSFSGFFDWRSLRRNLLPFHPLVWLGLTVCCLISFSLPALATPPDGKVVGQIKDGTGDPIPGATIELKPSLAGSFFSLVTDANGVFSIEDLHPGRYLVKISQPGFSTRTTEV